MIEIFVVGCVMTIALFLAVFERKDEVKGDEVVSTGPGYWNVPDRELKCGDTSSGDTSSDESDQETDPEEQQQIVATQDYARVLQLRLHRFGDYRTRKEVNDLLILLVYYYTVIIKILGVLLSNQSNQQANNIQNVPTITLYKEEEDFPLDEELPSKKKKTKDEKQAEVVMPICLRKDDEAMYHEASIDNLDVLIAQRRKIENYISHLSESDVDIVNVVPASLEDQPSITNDESDVSFNVSIGKNINENSYEPLIKKDDIIPELESLQAKLGDAKDEVNDELESLKTKLGYDLFPKIKPESSIDESDCSLSMPTLKSISIDDSDFDLSSSQITESEFIETEVELCPNKSDTLLVDKDSTIPIVELLEKVVKDDDQITVAQESVYENSYHTGAIPKYSHPDISKAAINSQTDNFPTPVIHVESFKEPENIFCNTDSLICESKPIDTQETSKAEIIKLKPIEKDILDGSDDEDVDIDDTEDSDVSIPNMKGSYTLHHEDFEVDEIYEDRDPLAYLMEEKESEDDLPADFVESFFSDESVPCVPASDTTYQIDSIIEEESEENSSDDDKEVESPVQLTVPSVTENNFAMTFSQAVDDDDNIEQNVFQDDGIVASSDTVEKKNIGDMEQNENVHSYQNGNMQREVLHKIKGLADTLAAIKNQELNVDCVIVEDITEDVIVVETESELKIYRDEPNSSKLDQCKAFNINDNLEVEVVTEGIKKNEGIESNNANYLPVSENQTFLKEESIVQNIAGNESLNTIQDLVDKSTVDQMEETNSNLYKPLSLSIGENEMNAKEYINNGTMSSQEYDDFISELDQSQDFNENESIVMFNEKTENADKPMEMNDAFESKTIGSVGSNIQMAIESVIQDENETNAQENIKNGTLPSQADGKNSSVLIVIESNDSGSVRNNIEMAIESVTRDIHFEDGKSSYENSDIVNGIDELSVKNSAELSSEAAVQYKQDGDAISIGKDQRTCSDIVKGFVSDKGESLYSEKDSVISVKKGEEDLLDLSEDQDCTAIDRCEAFSADIEAPEDFVYEGETEYQKTVRLENFKNLETLQAAIVSSDECNHKIVLDVHEFRHGDLRVSAVGETEILVEAVSEVPEKEPKAMQIRRFRQKFLLPDNATATDSIAALSSDGVLAIITPKKDGSIPSIKRKLPEDVETPEKSSKYMTKHDPRSNETEKSTIIDREMVECFLPILQRGNFFTDSIFQETRQDFNTAITEVLDKWGERSVHDPQRGTRREEPKEDNQVMVITDDDHNTRKILVDIADFTLDGEVKINVMDEELVVEGRTKKAEGGASSIKTFIRRFTLAPDIDPSAVTSVVTPDGILEITTPKKAVIPKLKEFSIQVIIELIVEESHTSPRKDSKTRRKLKDKSPAKDTDSSHSRKKKKIPEDGESEEYNNQAAAASYDDNLLKTKNTLKEEVYKINDEKEIVQSTEVSELMAQNQSLTGEDIQTGASLEGIKGSLGDNSSVAEGNYDQQIIASRADDNSDESDESQQKSKSAEHEPQVHITDIKRFILQSTQEFGSDDEAQQSKVSDDTDKSTTLEPKGELKNEKQDEQEEIFKSGVKSDLETATLTEETLSSLPSEDITLKDEVSVDISQSFDSVVDIPLKPELSESAEKVPVKVTVNGSLEDNHLIPIIQNGNSQKDNYEVGADFKKLLFYLPEELEEQSQDSSVEKENVIPSTYENYSKDIGDRYQTNMMVHPNKSHVTKNIPDTKQAKLPEAYVTLATNDDYAIGAMVLGHSLRSVGATRNLVVMITEDVSWDIRPMLQDIFNEVIVVNVMDSHDSAHLALLKRPELGVTFTKLHCWTLLQYSKCVFLDADTFVIQNPDDLFGYPELSAAPDIGWPDCFNSGMFVFVPNIWTYKQLLQHSQTIGSFDGGDQGVLNTFFPKWNFISFIFNMVASAVYTYLPAYIKYGSMTKIVHFIGSFKPWHHIFNKETGEVETAHGYHHLRGILNSWWKIYTSLVEPGILKITMGRQPKIKRSPGFDDLQGFARWESGTPDYLGQDSFINIQAYIDNKISQYELPNKKKSSEKKTSVSSPIAKKNNDSQNIDSPGSFHIKATKTEDASKENVTFLSKFSEDLSKKNNELDKQVQEIIEVPEIIKATEKKEGLKQPPNLEIEKTEKEDEDSDWVIKKSRGWRQSDFKSERFEVQQPESTDENDKRSLVSESYLLSDSSQKSEVKEVSPTEEAELLTSKPSLATEKKEDSARFERGAVHKKFSKSKKSKKSQKSSQKYDPFDISTTEVSTAGKSTLITDLNQSTPLYSEMLSRNLKDSKESSVTSDNTTADIALLNTIQLDTSIPKDKMDDFTPILETSPITHDQCVDPEQTFATTVRETAHKIDDMIVDLQTVIEDSTLSSISEADTTLIQKAEQNSGHQEVKSDQENNKVVEPAKKLKQSTIMEDEDLIKASQTHFRKSEDEIVYAIDESKIWELAGLRYLGPNAQMTEEYPKVESQATQESYMPKSSALAKGIKETSSSIETDLLKSGNRDEDESVYSKYSITSSKKGTSQQKDISSFVDIPLQKSSETQEEKIDNEPYISRKQKEHSDILYTSSKQEEHSNISSSSMLESSLTDLDKKLDYASNLFNIPSSGIITGTAASDSVDKKLTVGSEVDESAKVYEQNILSPNDKRKIEVQSEDARKLEKQQQDAKQLQDQTQELMQKAWAPEVSEDNKNKVPRKDAKKQDKKQKDAKQLHDQTQELMQQSRAPEVSEDNKNKLSSDKGKSLKAQAVSKKESKASDIEGVKEKTTATSEFTTEDSEASVDKTAMESEGVKPSTKSQPDVQKTDERAKEDSSQEFEKKQIAQDEASKLLSSKVEKDDSSKSAAGEVKLTTTESSAVGEVKSASELQEPTTAQDKSPKLLSSEAEKDAPSKSKSTTEKEPASAESSISGEFKSTAEQQELATAESSVAGNLKSATEQQQSSTAESSVAGELKSNTDQQGISTSSSSVDGELKSTTDQQELTTAKISQSKDDSLKTILPADISQQKSEELSKSVSEQSALEESVKSKLPSIQQVDKDVKSTVQKSVKEESVKVSDGSVKPKKSTVKTDVTEKQSTEIRKSTSTAKLDIQSSTSARRKEEEKSISTKDAKTLFQSQATAASTTAASGSTSDLRSTGFGSGLSNIGSKSTSYSALPGSSSPSSGYLATGTKSIASGSFTFKATEEYVKKKPPPRNRPFFNLRDFL